MADNRFRNFDTEIEHLDNRIRDIHHHEGASDTFHELLSERDKVSQEARLDVDRELPFTD